MELFLLAPILISFFLTFIVLPNWIKKANKIGLLWNDVNKINSEKKVAGSGGLIVIMSFVLSVLIYIAVRTFSNGSVNGISLNIFALLTVVLILAVIGLIDDILGWQQGGLSAKLRVFLIIVGSIPLVVINAGIHTMSIPFLGPINLGLLYPLLLIPLGITGAATTYNFLAGFNGLETGQGIIILSFISFIAYVTGSPWLAVVGLCMVASLIAFFLYNKYPAKVFPGDVLTYPIGALIAIIAILGNFEKIAIFIFIPYILETILKLRGNLKKQSFGAPQEDGSLELPYNKIYGVTHLSISILKKLKNKVYEKDVVYLIFIFQIIICFLALYIFREGIFL